jgi:hypothetical protein
MQHGEVARATQRSYWNHSLGEPAVPPGSAEEDAALARIAELREAEREDLHDSFAARRRRSARYWRARL